MLESQVGFLNLKKPTTFDVHTQPNLTVLLRWDDSHDNLNLNYTLCTVVGTV